MAKKSFKKDIASGTDRFFSVHDEAEETQDTEGTKNIEDTQGIQGIQDTSQVEEMSGAALDIDGIAGMRKMDTPPRDGTSASAYRINLKLDPGLKDYLADEAWRQRTSVTALLNRIIWEYKARAEG